jgi:Carboxypeptidase regulatory-like domain
MVVRRCVSGIVVLVLIISVSTLMKAQDVASITGIVTDQTSAVVADVSVTLKDPQTGVVYKGNTNAEGSYTINQVKPGPGYRIEFEHAGFKTAIISGVYMNVDKTRVQNAQLIIGGTRESVEVSAASETVTLDATDATIGNNFQVQFLNELPVQFRDSPQALLVDQPGVTLDGSVTGARTDQSRVTVDGLDVNDYATGQFGAIVGNAPVDSVQEFRGVTGGFLSNEAGGGGGQYELVTRSGSNSFHGSLSEYYRTRGLEANEWFNNNAVPQVPRSPLNRNQFGGTIGGPAIKNKLFFFFNYYGRRDILAGQQDRTVPMDSFRNETLTYYNDASLTTTGTLNAAQVAALDPLKVGFNPALFDPSTGLFATRYPHANDFSGHVGDLINTAGFLFNAPTKYAEDLYVERVDYNLNDKMKLYGVGHVARTNATQNAIQFPGDPLTSPFFDRSYSWVVGHVWTLNNSMVNQASYGEVYESYNFPNTYNPTGTTQYGALGGTGAGGAILSGPYASAINQQGRTYPIPVVRDDFSWDKGKHSFRFGGTFKWPNPGGYTVLDYDSPTIGLGGLMPNLDSTLRPGDICTSATNAITPCNTSAVGRYDPAFALALAPYTSVSSTFNYNAQGTAFAQGTGSRTQYRYYETELYFGDTWKLTPKLTLSYGLRWVDYTVPYEVHGIESVQSTGFNSYFADRIAQSAASESGNLAVPLISYNLGGKANHAPGYFNPTHKDFGPRLAAAYQFDSKTVFNVGAAILFDQTIVNAVQYQQSQYSYLFQASQTNPLGVANNPEATLGGGGGVTRFSGLSNPPAFPTPPAISRPFYPFVAGSGSSAVPFGLANGLAFNESIDPNLKTPYNIQFNFGFERQIRGGFILKASYVGRLGRRLLSQVDAEQLIEFRDPASGQLMSSAFTNITNQLRQGVNPLAVTAQPWYENQLGPGFGQSIGFPNNTSIVTYFLTPYVARGDFADTTEALSSFGLLPANVGMAAQFSENTFYNNEGSSNYNGMLATLHKNAGYGLQFDLNYTWSHSIDNVSVIANAPAIGGYGFICDQLRPRECRGNSDFDATQYFNGNFIYDLPFGKGKSFFGTAPRWVNEVVGGWTVSGIPSWHSGNPYFASSLAFVAGYSNNAPAILTGPPSDLKIHLNGGKGNPLYGYANPTQANADYTGPLGFNIGSRNNLRGPGFFSMDMGLAKAIPLWTESVSLKLRGDAFNVFNHPSFNAPCADITSVTCVYGIIGSTSSSARVLQISARVEF